MSAVVAVFQYVLNPDHGITLYVSGALAVVLLAVGAVVGVRQGVWRSSPGD
jgi:hypothetical protein